MVPITRLYADADGHARFEDIETRTFGPGDILLVEDTEAPASQKGIAAHQRVTFSAIVSLARAGAVHMDIKAWGGGGGAWHDVGGLLSPSARLRSC
jgi:hypothetical protein